MKLQERNSLWLALACVALTVVLAGDRKALSSEQAEGPVAEKKARMATPRPKCGP